jgi:hypothetical protein
LVIVRRDIELAILKRCFLESTRNDLRILTENQIKSETLIKTLEQDRIRLQTELNVVKHELEERQRDLQKDRIRIENMIRQEEVNVQSNKSCNR